MNEINTITVGILKLLLLIPLFGFFCMVIIGMSGHWWPLVLTGILVGGWYWSRAEQAQKKQKAYLEQQVEITRQNMIKAQAEAERAQRKADIADAVQQAMEQAEASKQRKQRVEGQWN